MISFQQRAIVPDRVVMQEVEGESVLLNLDSKHSFALDEVGTRLWAVLTAAPSIQEAYEALLAQFDVPPEVLRADMEAWIGQLLENGLLELASDWPSLLRWGPAGLQSAVSHGRRTRMGSVVSGLQPTESQPEALRFIRLCLRGRWQPEALDMARRLAAQTRLDWTGLSTLATAQGLGPLLYHVVRRRDLVPPLVEKVWREQRLRNALRDRLLRAELVTILHSLAGQGVGVILLKGAALAQTVYADIGLRPMFDQDLLVHPQDARRALRILAGLGYRREGLEARPDADLTYESQVLLRKQGLEDFAVEVHWSLFDSPYYQHSLPMDWFWQTALPVQIGAASARVLCPEALVLHLCGHLRLHHGPAEATLLWLHDVAEVLVQYQDGIDWDELLQRAQECELVLSAQEVLTEVADEWDAPIPAEALSRLGALQPSAAEVRVMAQLGAGQRPVAQRFWFDLASIDGWRSRLHYAWIQLFPSVTYMQRRYRIRHLLLVPLYYPYRWWIGLRGLVAARIRAQRAAGQKRPGSC